MYTEQISPIMAADNTRTTSEITTARVASRPAGGFTVASLPPQPKRAAQGRRSHFGAEFRGRETWWYASMPVWGSVEASTVHATPVALATCTAWPAWQDRNVPGVMGLHATCGHLLCNLNNAGRDAHE